MFKMRVVRWQNRKEHQSVLEQYFRLRHEIYIDRRGWRDIERPIGMEIDAFDDRQAVYLIGVDRDNRVRAGTRLVPTLRPHLLADVFPELAGNEPPRTDDIMEWTRFFVAPDLQTHASGRPSQAAGVVLCGMLEFGLQRKLRGFSVVCETFWPDRFRSLGWLIEPLGPLLHRPDGDIVAILIHLKADMVQQTRRAYGLPLEEPCLEEEPSDDRTGAIVAQGRAGALSPE